MPLQTYIPARDPKGLSLEQVKLAAPAAFAAKPSPKVSERYTFLNTMDLVKPLLEKNWLITGATQRATRLTGRDPRFTRHQLNMQPAPPACRKLVKVGDVRPELTLINSHDRQSRYHMWGGLLRLACLNGMTVKSLEFAGYSRTHVGDQADILEHADAAMKAASEAGLLVADMEKVQLTDAQQKRFAAKAAELAYDRQDFDPTVLLATRRAADEGNTLWQVYNRVQENLVRGGVAIHHSSGTRRDSTTRGITHIQRAVDLNLDLWNLAAAQVKAA